jgi:hypothetical protein
MDRGCMRGSLCRGDEDGFLVHGEKKGRAISESAGEGSIPYLTFFY